jgi:hypothetical protein
MLNQKTLFINIFKLNKRYIYLVGDTTIRFARYCFMPSWPMV